MMEIVNVAKNKTYKFLYFQTYMKKFFALAILLSWFMTFASANTTDDAVQWMHTNGLTVSTTTADFKADKWLRRDEAAKFFVNFAKILWKTGYIKTDAQCTFLDINQSWSDLKKVVVESCKLWLFQWGKGKFNPQNQLTNEQSIAVLIRLLVGSQNETGISRRSDNYYKKANELKLLQIGRASCRERVFRAVKI